MNLADDSIKTETKEALASLSMELEKHPILYERQP
jgi:hypothetical protein